VVACRRGFTLIELLVVMAIIATLLSIAAPRYFDHLDRARETTLRQTLAVMRDSIDKFRADRGRYPEDLQELVAKRYLRAVPKDPLTDSASGWLILPPPEGEEGNVGDVRSGASGNGRDGTPYGDW
jgi:general secretion pathway protein G